MKTIQTALSKVDLGRIVTLGFFILSFGCSSVFHHVPKFHIATIAGTQVNQSGAVTIPAKTETRVSDSQLLIPSGSHVEIRDAPDGFSLVSLDLKSPAVFAGHQTSEKISAPVPHVPEPPTLAEQTQAKGQWLFWGISAACALLGGLAIYLGHAKAALFLMAAAICFPLIAKLASLLLAFASLALLVGIAIALVWAWYLMRKYHPDYIASVKAEAANLEKQFAAKV